MKSILPKSLKIHSRLKFAMTLSGILKTIFKISDMARFNKNNFPDDRLLYFFLFKKKIFFD